MMNNRDDVISPEELSATPFLFVQIGYGYWLDSMFHHDVRREGPLEGRLKREGLGV